MKMCEEIQQSLQEHFIDVEVNCVDSYLQALNYVSRYQYTLVIMGLHFSETDGAAFVRKLRTLDSVPILVLSARAVADEEVKMLNAGADRYIEYKKHMDMEQCLANALAIMRRHSTPDAEQFSYTLISGSGLKINPRQRKAYVNGIDLQVTPKQFALLSSLIKHVGEVVSKEQLYEDAWTLEYDINSDEALKYHIKELRKKLREHGLDHRIETAWGVGYFFSLDDL